VEARNAWYHRFLSGLTKRPAIVLCVVVAIMTAMASMGLLLRRDFFAPVERDQFIIDLYAPQGSSLAHTLDLVQPVEKLLAETPNVTSYGAFVGRNAPLVFYNLWVQETYANHFAQFVVNVTDWQESASTARRVQEQLQTKLPGAHCVVHILEHGAPFVAPFEVRITGPNLETLQELGRRAGTMLAATPGVRNVRDNFGNEALQLVAQVNEPVARTIGIDQGTVADELRYRLDGLVASHLQEADERIDIRVRLADAQRDDIADLNAVYFKPSGDAPLIPFSSVATLEPSWEAASIYRRDGQRALSVLAYPGFGLTAAQVSEQFEPKLQQMAATLPPGYHLELGGENEQRHEAESNLRNRSIYTFCIIILLLVAQFHSFGLAALILAVIPMSLGGAMAGLWLTGYPLNFMAIMGMMMLVGVMVTNAIILVERYEQLRDTGKPMREIVIEGTHERTLHVVVTSVNTIAGFIPLALSHSPLWPPLAIAIIGGLTMSTVICLVALPAGYLLLRRPATVAGLSEAG
jgi:multidrug efflux pump subunit AcrB